MPIIRNPDNVLMDDGAPDPKALTHVLKEHDQMISRYNLLADYYDGKHPIAERELMDPDAPNNKLVINYAEYISDFASSYFMGNEIQYTGNAIDPILDAFSEQHIHMVDTELARDLSRFGVAYELVYMSSDDTPIPKSTNIDPRNAVIVVDNSVEYKTLLGIYRYAHMDKDNKQDGETVMVYTPTHIYECHYKQDLKLIEDSPHPFGRCPMLEYWNKPNLKADYESVL